MKSSLVLKRYHVLYGIALAVPVVYSFYFFRAIMRTNFVSLEFAHKWFDRREAENASGNIIHLIGASGHAASILGKTNEWLIPPDNNRTNYAMTFNKNIDEWIAANAPSFDPVRVNRKVTTHEFGHHFKVNANGTFQHCDSATHSNPAYVCLMGGNHLDFSAQWNNGVAEFDADATSTESTFGQGDVYDVRYEADPLPFNP
jgi:hypothetical protein